MKIVASLLALLVGSVAIGCGSHANPLGGGGGTTTATGTGPTGTTGTTGTTGPTCSPGGAACQGFAECCSGVCDHQVCTACGAEGQSCAPDGCCGNLGCNNGTCSACKESDSPCALASECCSSVCDQGTCRACNSTGTSCTLADDCCSGNCCNGICETDACCVSSAKCQDKFLPPGNATLCGKAAEAYDALISCLCDPGAPCQALCGQSGFCPNGSGLPSNPCITCLNSASGCQQQAMDCTQN